MREIKFRAWNKKEKRMEEIDGYFLYIADNKIYEVSEGHFHYETYIEKKDVTDDYELMQYTGKKDIKGIEIYESDIVLWGSSVALVVWSEKHCSFKLSYKNNLYDLWLKHEVLGNIYEKSELLEVK